MARSRKRLAMAYELFFDQPAVHPPDHFGASQDVAKQRLGGGSGEAGLRGHLDPHEGLRVRRGRYRRRSLFGPDPCTQHQHTMKQHKGESNMAYSVMI